MMQMLQMMMEDREATRAERQANLAALQQIAQNNQGHGNHDHPGSKLKNFQNTNPPMFSKTEEPLDADDWLQTMENNLEVAGVEAAEKYFATHYLSGPARAWWTSARAMNAGQMMNWEDFKLKFSKYHVPQGLIKKMRDEFRELKQGRMSVVEYRDVSYSSNPNNTNNHPNGNNNNPNNAPKTGSNTVPINPKDKSTINCYECGVVGHYSNECPKKLARIAANTAAPAQQQRRFAGRKNQNNNNGRLYHMNAAEAQEAPQAMPTLGQEDNDKCENLPCSGAPRHAMPRQSAHGKRPDTHGHDVARPTPLTPCSLLAPVDSPRPQQPHGHAHWLALDRSPSPWPTPSATGTRTRGR
ncbi:hypothetical protein QYE76_062830 [Lolium multiflorum]|uniref:CCHC-type domain-containing protein n=1 Tax=Lolium multiflorum TaxID=4521 RepID=A0AAD8S4H5_LOLMU|nr:hypothetical protein QYE76_062830 [Lolium multiflorum]